VFGLPLLKREILPGLLAGSWQMTAAKRRKRRTTPTKIPSAML